MTYFVVHALPSKTLYNVICKLEPNNSLNSILDKNVDGQIHDIDVSGNFEEEPYLVLDCNFETACEFLKWVRSNSEDSISSVSVKYDLGWEIGVITLTNYGIWLFKTEDIGVYGEHSMRQWCESNGIEFDPAAVLHNETRDEVQDAFINFLNQNGSPEGLENAEIFNVFVEQGFEYFVQVL
jgi:hypothetical protein